MNALISMFFDNTYFSNDLFSFSFYFIYLFIFFFFFFYYFVPFLLFLNFFLIFFSIQNHISLGLLVLHTNFQLTHYYKLNCSIQTELYYFRLKNIISFQI